MPVSQTTHNSDSVEVAELRAKINDLSQYIEENVASGRRRSLAQTHLETAGMYAIKAMTVGDSD